MKLTELTMRVGDLSKNAEFDAGINKTAWKEHPHVADIESYEVRSDGERYSIWDKDELIASAILEKGDPAEVRNIWTSKPYRGKGVLSKLLWFFKSREMQSRMILGPMHSTDTQSIVSQGLKSFTKSWYNTKTQEIVPVTPDTLDRKNQKYYSFGGETEWRVMLESQPFDEPWPMFREHKDFVKESYGAFTEEF